MKTKRIFLAHPKGLEDAELARLAGRAWHALRLLAVPNADDWNIIVTTGKDDFDARWSQIGSWDAWAAEVVHGKFHYASDEPRYHAIVLTHEKLGNATRLIVQTALAARKPVLLLKGDGTLVVISVVVEENRDNWKSGWSAR